MEVPLTVEAATVASLELHGVGGCQRYGRRESGPKVSQLEADLRGVGPAEPQLEMAYPSLSEESSRRVGDAEEHDRQHRRESEPSVRGAERARRAEELQEERGGVAEEQVAVRETPGATISGTEFCKIRSATAAFHPGGG